MIDRIRGYSIFFCGLLYVGTALAGITSLEGLLAAITLLVLIQCLPAINAITKVVFTALFGIGSILLIWSGAGIAVWRSALIKNGDILTLMLFVPLLSVPFKFPRYQHSLKQVIQKIIQSSSSSVYVFTHAISHMLGVIFNLACIPMTYYIIKAGADIKNPNIMAGAAARGYTTTCFWSPNSGAVGLVLAYWGGSVVEIIPFGLPLAVIALAVGWFENQYLSNLLTRKEYKTKKNEFENENNQAAITVPDNHNSNKDFYWLVFAVMLLLGIVIILDWKTSLGILVIVPVMSLLYPFAWSIFAGEQQRHWISFKNFLSDTLPRMSNEVVIFLGAGFFAVAVSSSKIGRYLPGVFNSVSDSPTLLVAIIIIIVVGLSIIGFHPVLTITSIVSSLTPQLVGLPHSLLAVMVLAAWGLAVTCSPFSACSLSLSNITGVNPLIVGLRWQLVFTGLLFIVTLLYFNIMLSCFY
jgi:hypothetical protein